MHLDVLTSINPVLMVLLPVLYTIAEIIKMTPVKRWLIPFILWGISVMLTIIYLLSEEIALTNVFTGIFQGTLLSMITVGGNQFVKQATEKRIIDNKKSNSQSNQALKKKEDLWASSHGDIY